MLKIYKYKINPENINLKIIMHCIRTVIFWLCRNLMVDKLNLIVLIPQCGEFLPSPPQKTLFPSFFFCFLGTFKATLASGIVF